MPRKLICSAALLACTLLPTGCDTHQVTQFAEFASAGTAFESAYHTYLLQAGSSFIAQNNTSILQTRPPFLMAATAPLDAATSSAVQGTLSEQDEQIRQYLKTLQLIDNHATLLAAWFAGVTQLAAVKPSAATTASLGSLADNIQALNGKLGALTIGGLSLKDALGSLNTLAVAHFQAAALEHAMQHDGQIILTALVLQHEAIRLLSTGMKNELTTINSAQENAVVFAPYLAPGTISPGWPAAREALLRQQVALESGDFAADAVQQLQADLKLLAANPSTNIDFSPLMITIGRMSGYVAAAKSAAVQPLTAPASSAASPSSSSSASAVPPQSAAAHLKP